MKRKNKFMHNKYEPKLGTGNAFCFFMGMIELGIIFLQKIILMEPPFLMVKGSDIYM